MPSAAPKKKKLVLDNVAARAVPELFPVEVRQWVAVRGVADQGFEALIVEEAPMEVVGAGLGSDIDDAAAGSAKLSICTAGNDLKFLYGFEGDINRRLLAAGLLAEEAVDAVAAIKADVVEDASLSVDANFVAIRTLDGADAGRKREQVLEFAAQHRRGLDDLIVERRGQGIRNNIHLRGGGDDDRLGGARNFKRQLERCGETSRERQVLLNGRRKSGLRNFDDVATRLQRRQTKVPRPICHGFMNTAVSTASTSTAAPGITAQAESVTSP